MDPSLYLTIGTGIGGGFITRGKPLIGMVNLEMGHLRIPHDRELDPFEGNCPFHGDCFEGLANGTAIEKRLGVTGAVIPECDPFWDVEADYIAVALNELHPDLVAVARSSWVGESWGANICSRKFRRESVSC